MKIKAFQIPLLLLIIDLSLSIPAISSIVNVRVGSVSFLGVYRLGALVILALTLLLILKKNKYFLQKKIFLVPIFLLILLSILQAIAISPRSLASAHSRGLVRILFWFFSYLSLTTILTPRNEQRIRNVLLGFLTFLFLITIIQYPILVIQSKLSIGSILSALVGGSKIKTFGIFHAANEDANFMMTVFPLALLRVESTKGPKKILFRYILIFGTLLALLLNGTRTAIFITFPLVLFMYYSRLSMGRTLIFSTLVSAGCGLYLLADASIITGTFNDELNDGGSFGYRLEHAWIPAISYTLRYSPIFGFGARGWEYLNEHIRLFDVVNEWGVIQGSAAPHNVYVWAFVTWGTVGLAFYISLIFILLRQSFLLFKTNRLKFQSDRNIGKALFCSVCAYCLWGFISNAHAPFGWITLFMLACIIASLETKVLSEKLASNKSGVNRNPLIEIR
ncbi:O-antigen ligase family protein [Oscillatoria sp. CS-180]|uniref:O-antigen ligase family protein n=1 Tax=Oscillatoria sp. CS-180 TaxID=3021720 RepID=UPI00232B4540|nr:O-antigen ligase family protein [Oscillatoria sp. CS-180]MDB9526428.1 O-antigen ligase family protein [Oscillatoria sp. CS-180]